MLFLSRVHTRKFFCTRFDRRAYKRGYRIKNRDALKVARELRISVSEARKQLAKPAGLPLD